MSKFACGAVAVDVADLVVGEFADGVGAGESISKLLGCGGTDEGAVDFSECGRVIGRSL